MPQIPNALSSDVLSIRKITATEAHGAGGRWMVSSTTSTEGSCRLTPYSVFAFLFAAGLFVHNGSFGFFSKPSPDLMLTLATLAVMLRPSSIPRMLWMVGGLVIAFTPHAPFWVNHALLQFMQAIWIAGAIGVLARRHGRLPSGEEVLALAAPALRVAIVPVYAWAVLHKLNATFFDPQLSCAATMYGWLAGKFPFLPTAAWSSVGAIYGTLLAEAAVPVLLMFERTRTLAVLGGLAFHFVLGINGFFNFTAFVTGWYALFLSPDLLRAIESSVVQSRLGGWAERIARLAGHPMAFPAAAASAIAAAFVPTLLGIPFEVSGPLVDRGTLVIWAPLTLALGAVLAWVLYRERRIFGEGIRLSMGPTGWVFVGLIALNGFSPYLGLKTESSYAMFSNLQTEGPFWNHLLFPRSMRVFGFQDELVEVLESSDPALSQRAGSFQAFFAFQGTAAARPEHSVRYRIGEREFWVPRIGDDPRLSAGPNPVLARLFWFRAVSPPEKNDCRH
jgi:hypothetical protein